MGINSAWTQPSRPSLADLHNRSEIDRQVSCLVAGHHGGFKLAAEHGLNYSEQGERLEFRHARRLALRMQERLGKGILIFDSKKLYPASVLGAAGPQSLYRPGARNVVESKWREPLHGRTWTTKSRRTTGHSHAILHNAMLLSQCMGESRIASLA